MAGVTATSQAPPVTQTYIITPSPRPIGTLPSKPPTTKTPEPPTPTRTTVALPTRTLRPTPTPEPLQHMRVNTTLPLNIRACAGTSCAIVDTAPPGTILAVTPGVEVADGFWWRKIDATGEWVAEFHIDSGTYYLTEYP